MVGEGIGFWVGVAAGGVEVISGSRGDGTGGGRTSRFLLGVRGDA